MQYAKEYIFILGRNHELSIEEILAVLGKQGIAYKQLLSSKEVLLLQAKNDIDITFLNKTLGGTVKIAEVVSRVTDSNDIEKYFFSDSFTADFFPNNNGKVTFGLSLYDGYGGKELYNVIRSSLSAYIKQIKQVLQENDIRSRFPKIEGSFLSSVSVQKNKLLSQGAEILLVPTNDYIYIGKTLAVQEFEAFSKRDFGRPVRDMRSGVMPPKLARMMINLAQIRKDEKLLDPFCGSGTILQEAAYLGYSDITGTDYSKKAIEDTKQNITWLDQQGVSMSKILIEECDVASLSHRFPLSSFNAIVTEPYLGPNHQKTPRRDEIVTIQKELHALYLKAWQEFFSVLQSEGTIVMILPVFNLHKQFFFMDILGDIEKKGFTQIPLSQSARKSQIIGNSYDFVLREIVKYRKEEK